jgi:hypothetical protein
MPWPIIFPGCRQEMKITHLSIYKFVRAALAAPTLIPSRSGYLDNSRDTYPRRMC